MMITIILKSTVLYWATALDLLLILTVLFIKFDKKKHAAIAWGQIVGSSLLVLVSLVFALVLQLVPQQWILGLMGLIPLAFGLKYLFVGDDDEDELDELLEKRNQKNLFVMVVFLSFASCGADNIALFTPFFMTLHTHILLISIITFMVNIFILGFIGQYLARIPHFHDLLSRYSRWVLAIVYIGLGLMILIETKALSHLIDFIKAIL